MIRGQNDMGAKWIQGEQELSEDNDALRAATIIK